jgi:hypothetical protein
MKNIPIYWRTALKNISFTLIFLAISSPQIQAQETVPVSLCTYWTCPKNSQSCTCAATERALKIPTKFITPEPQQTTSAEIDLKITADFQGAIKGARELAEKDSTTTGVTKIKSGENLHQILARERSLYTTSGSYYEKVQATPLIDFTIEDRKDCISSPKSRLESCKTVPFYVFPTKHNNTYFECRSTGSSYSLVPERLCAQRTFISKNTHISQLIKSSAIANNTWESIPRYISTLFTN